MNLLFVCSGNTCRSPMAEVIALAQMRTAGGFGKSAVTSAGLAAYPGDSANPASVRVCAEHGLDLSNHRSKSLTTDLIEASDHIYTMTQSQALQLQRILPQYAAKVTPLIPDGDVKDPYGQNDTVYANCYNQIEQAIEALIPQWKDELEKETNL